MAGPPIHEIAVERRSPTVVTAAGELFFSGTEGRAGSLLELGAGRNRNRWRERFQSRTVFGLVPEPIPLILFSPQPVRSFPIENDQDPQQQGGDDGE